MKKLYQTMGKTPWKKCTVYLQLLHHFGEVFFEPFASCCCQKVKKTPSVFHVSGPLGTLSKRSKIARILPCGFGHSEGPSTPPPLHQRLATGPGATKIFGWILCPFPTSFPLRYIHIYIYKSKGISPKTLF